MAAEGLKMDAGIGRRLSRLLFRGADVAALPERVRRIVIDEDRASERLIGGVQLCVGLTLWMLYLITPRPSDAA